MSGVATIVFVCIFGIFLVLFLCFILRSGHGKSVWGCGCFILSEWCSNFCIFFSVAFSLFFPGSDYVRLFGDVAVFFFFFFLLSGVATVVFLYMLMSFGSVCGFTLRSGRGETVWAM